MNLSSDLNEYKKRLRHIEGTVEEAVKQEMEPYKHTLEQHQKQMLDKCAVSYCTYFRCSKRHYPGTLFKRPFQNEDTWKRTV